MSESCDYLVPETGLPCGADADMNIITVCPLMESISLCDDHCDIPDDEVKALMAAKGKEAMRLRNIEAVLGIPTRLVEVEYNPEGGKPRDRWMRFCYDQRFAPEVPSHYPGYVSLRGMN